MPCASSACRSLPSRFARSRSSAAPRFGRSSPHEDLVMGKQDIDIARAVKLQPIQAIGETLGLNGADLEPYGSYKAKIRWQVIDRVGGRPDPTLVLVTAMTPTPARHGKSTTTIGLPDALRRHGKRAIDAIREPSLGPAFGVKGTGTGGEFRAAGAMGVLMKDAIKPNLVQPLEGTPALVHGGPFGNIAHGCNSLIATRLGLKLGEFLVTEAGFASDLGAEKFVDIKCRTAGLVPSVAVVVATVRALKMHAGVALTELPVEDVAAVRRGCDNLAKHVENVRRFGLAPVVALNHFTGDTDAEVAAVLETCRDWGVPAEVSRGWAEGGAGTTELAQTVLDTIKGADRTAFRFLYPDDMPLERKIETIATQVYGADGVRLSPAAAQKLARWQAMGHGRLPVCMAKTQNSLSDDPKKIGRPRAFTITVRDARLCAGAGFVVAYAGDVLTMPGLPKVPGAEGMDVDATGNVTGLF